MQIVHIEYTKRVKKTKKELQQELDGHTETFKRFVDEYKRVPSKEPTYTVEMSMKELQLVSFYLELENRKPILNVKVETKIKKGEQR